MDLLDTQLFSVIGEDCFTRLVAAFYRQIPGDDILGPMYEGREMPAAELRMREFLIQRFGGPDTYSQRRGHPRLRMRHAPFHIDQHARDRWIELMGKALAEARLPESAERHLRHFFEATATFLMNQAA